MEAQPLSHPRPEYMTTEGPAWQWLIIEHEDGRLDDLGFVQTRMLMPVFPLDVDNPTPAPDPREIRHRFEWRSESGERHGAVLLGDEDRGPDRCFKHPYQVDMPGRRQFWYVGKEAYRKAIEAGLLSNSGTTA